jgi:hypothetical protein
MAIDETNLERRQELQHDEEANIFDVNIVIAIVAYAFLSYFVVSLVRFIFYHEL